MVTDKINLRRIIGRVKPYSNYLFAAWAVIIITVSSVPSLRTLRVRAGEFSLRLDYIIHATIYAILGFLGYLSFTDRNLFLRWRKLFLISFALLLFAFVDEFHQKYIPGRTFNLVDLISNITGIIAAFVFCYKIFTKSGKSRDKA